MITPDRGHQFGGYFRRDDPLKPDVCFGLQWLNSYDCGTYIDSNGKLQGISFIVMHVDSFEDSGGKFQESFDLSLDDADYFCMNPMFQAAAAGVPVKQEDLVNLPWLPQSVQYLLMMDLAEGLSPTEMFERRAAVLSYRFFGFTYDEMITTHPEILQPVDVEGISYPNIQRCSLEAP